MTTHGQTLRTFATWAEVVGLRAGDRYLIVNPFFHTFGYKAGILACLMAGATMVPEPVFDVDVVLQRVADERISVLPGPPTIFQSILDHPKRDAFDLSTLRLVVTGAAVVPVELVESLWSDLGIETVLTAYGLTEATGTVTMCRRGDSAEVISATSGRAIPGRRGAHRRRRRRRGADRRAGRDRGPGLQRDVRLLPRRRGHRRGHRRRTGWLHTGDVGFLDAAGNLAITDRLKDMYVSGGFNVYPAEVEAVLRRHPAVGPGGGGRGPRPPDGRGRPGRRRARPPARTPRTLGDRAARLRQGAAGQLQGARGGWRWSTCCPPTPAARSSNASSGPGLGRLSGPDAHPRSHRPSHTEQTATPSRPHTPSRRSTTCEASSTPDPTSRSPTS